MTSGQRTDGLTIAMWAVAFCVMCFIYLPVLIIIFYSFNPDVVNSFPMKGISIRWYEKLMENTSIWKSLQNSLMVAFYGVTCALILGIPGAFAIYKYKFPGKVFFRRLVTMPLMLPGIITGVSLLHFFILAGARLSLTAVIIGHITFLVPVVITQIYARLERIDSALEEASMDLFANRIQTFFHVVLPNIRTSIIGAALLAFTISLDEVPVTFFLTGRDNTLPLEIWAMLRTGITPEINAITTVIFLFSVVIIVMSQWFLGKDEAKMRAK
ncbi:ABC transporter permease [Brevibacillus fluminis]|uniref:ABC transporter permease n=1 Tax=Brevibacillus fluminis TaxID=511487 RepID=A0A3M8DNT3_9BACL|nr:ABC transporter permease [Brevibacillus fluminis]RNB89760.1 ABC transporter permease [Brevibacillus fluminis]